MTEPQHGDAADGAAAFKAWDDYWRLSRALAQHALDPAAVGMDSQASTRAFAAWGEFANSLGIGANFGKTKPQEVWLGMAPALAHLSEYHRIVERMAQLSAQFQSCYADFQQQGAAIGEQALQGARKQWEADPVLAQSPAAAYETWIDCAERAYAQAAHGEPFARSMGELCNLLSAFKSERAKFLEVLARHLNLPSRSEVDTLHRQVKELAAALRMPAASAAKAAPKPRKSRTRSRK